MPKRLCVLETIKTLISQYLITHITLHHVSLTSGIWPSPGVLDNLQRIRCSNGSHNDEGKPDGPCGPQQPCTRCQGQQGRCSCPGSSCIRQSGLQDHACWREGGFRGEHPDTSLLHNVSSSGSGHALGYCCGVESLLDSMGCRV